MASPPKTPRSAKTHSSLYQRVKLRTEVRLGVLDTLQIVPFRGFGSRKSFILEGRVIEAKGISKPTDDTGVLENIANTIRRFDSDEIPDAKLRATFRGRRYETTTDREGYFAFRFDAAGATRTGWHSARVELIESIVGQAGIETRGTMLLPSGRAEYAVVSDLDDTVIKTGAYEPTTMARVILSSNARTRTAFPGVARLYQELEKGPDGRGRNPVFYVSRSGWNLYDLFEAFLEEQEMPRGPILLRDLSLIEKASEAVSHHDHKVSRIEAILKMYPKLPLVLIGDSGQHDPETYLSIVKKHPTRIRAVYLRDVTRGARDREVLAIARKIEKLGVPALASDDTLAVAVHAAAKGLLRASRLDAIRASRDAALTGENSAVFE